MVEVLRLKLDLDPTKPFNVEGYIAQKASTHFSGAQVSTNIPVLISSITM